MGKLTGRCKHYRAKLFTREGGEHTGLDLFAKCGDCGFEGVDFPHIECEQKSDITPAMRSDVLSAFYAGARHSTPDTGKDG